MNADAPTVANSADCRQRTIVHGMQVDAGAVSSIGIGSQTEYGANGWNRFRIRCVPMVTGAPTYQPTRPSVEPTAGPTRDPTPLPTADPSSTTHDPTLTPTKFPTWG